MLIDIISIFPEYLAPAQLSLLGRASRTGLIQVRVHDLRQWTDDRHRTVDDTPYGGGAGMVMMAEPWGRAIDAVLNQHDDRTVLDQGDDLALLNQPEEQIADLGAAPNPTACVLVVPTASGKLFRQQTAKRLAGVGRLLFACGRYEGIDARVAEHYRRRCDVQLEELSIGDYVLAGGEAAALVMIEAIVRLIPGVLGNAESLTEESHVEDGLLEYPVYTRPPLWRNLPVPEVLLSGDHQRIAVWRRQQAELRTGTMRPDLSVLGEMPGSAVTAEK